MAISGWQLRFFTMILFAVSTVLAQNEEQKAPTYGWFNNIVGGLNLTQTSFDNWEQGGENSLSWQLNFNAKFERKEKKFDWTSTGKIAYGSIRVGDQESRKSVDEIRLESVFSYKLGVLVNPFLSATGETQFAKGYQYSDTGKTAISDFMDPAYFTQSAGVGFSPDDAFKTRLGAALKETFTQDFPKPYADDPETPDVIEKIKVEVGIESVSEFSRKLAENILLSSNLQLFSNLVSFQEIDVRWDNIITAKVAKYVDVTFNLKLFYDRNISKKRQIKQALALGLTYTFL